MGEGRSQNNGSLRGVSLGCSVYLSVLSVLEPELEGRQGKMAREALGIRRPFPSSLFSSFPAVLGEDVLATDGWERAD